MIYIQSLMARIRSTQQRAMSITAKNTVTTRLNQKFRRILTKLSTQLFADSYFTLFPESVFAEQKFLILLISASCILKIL
jgi:hypothetical protein